VITPAEARQIIEHRTQAFYFGDGLVDPNENNGADLARLTGTKWIRRAMAIAASLDHEDSQDQWKGGLLSTALDKAMNWWRYRKKARWGLKVPVIYKINDRAMGLQLAWARARGADV